MHEDPVLESASLLGGMLSRCAEKGRKVDLIRAVPKMMSLSPSFVNGEVGSRPWELWPDLIPLPFTKGRYHQFFHFSQYSEKNPEASESHNTDKKGQSF